MDQNQQTAQTYPSIMDIAHSVMTDPASAKPQDVTRLASFVIDHPEHIAFYRRTSGAFQPNGALGRRLEGARGGDLPKQIAQAALPAETGDPVQHAELGTADLHADADASEQRAT